MTENGHNQFSQTWQEFEELERSDLYEILRLRSEVFVLEQKSFYQDIDRWDQQAIHFQMKQGDELVGYFRVLKPGVRYDEHCLSRLLVPKKWRARNLGKRLMEILLASDFGTQDNRISAQAYLQKFYEFYGFKLLGDEYDEDGIPHIEMLRKGWSSS